MNCLKCGNGNMIIKLGPFGLFGACDNYPKCNNTKNLEDILFEILKKDGITIYSWKHECWKCHKKTKVYTYFINKQIKDYMHSYAELGNLGLGSINSIDRYLMNNYKTINNNYSKTRNCYCVSNNCSHCNALIGNNFIVDDPHDIFDDWVNSNLDKYIAEKIPLEKINMSKDELHNLDDYFIQIG